MQLLANFKEMRVLDLAIRTGVVSCRCFVGTVGKARAIGHLNPCSKVHSLGKKQLLVRTLVLFNFFSLLHSKEIL